MKNVSNEQLDDWIEFVEDRCVMNLNEQSHHIYEKLFVSLVIKFKIDFFVSRPVSEMRYPMISDKLHRLGWKSKVMWKEGIRRTSTFSYFSVFCDVKIKNICVIYVLLYTVMMFCVVFS